MIVTIVAAIGKNRVMGQRGQLPWHLPEDLKHFKSVTWGKPIVMGRKTYESIGKCLPGRRNVILSRRHLKIENAEVFSSLQSALDALTREEEVMIIGGAQIFEQALTYAQKMILTVIEHDFEGDVFFPEWDQKEWKEISREEHFSHDYTYYFSIWKRT